MPGDCTPIPKEYPAGATDKQKQLIDAAYDAYLLCLSNCTGDLACCKNCLSNYTTRVLEIMAGGD